MNLDQFANLMQRRAKTLERRIGEIKAQVVTAGLYSLAWGTPVDKGDAVSNWQVKVGSAAQGTLPAFVPGKDQSTEAANRQRMLEAAKPVLKTIVAGQEVHITNNLHYIVDLNNGSSTQAPAGMTEGALVAMRAKLANIKIFTE